MTIKAAPALDKVPFVDLAAQQAEILDGIMEDLRGIFASGAFVGGPEVAAFEAEYAEFVGVAACVGLGNGTDAVEFALRAVGVSASDEVIVPANTFVATVEAVCRIGANPVLVDVHPDTLLIDVAQLESVITARTRAVVPVHLYGQIAPVEQVRDALAGSGISVVEDAAQSQGATRHGIASGALGDAAATSFYPGKNLGAGGDAGAVTTNDTTVADRVRLLGAHGSRIKYVHETLGFNSRLDAVQAVVLRHKLRRLAMWNASRRVAADYYSELLEGVSAVKPPTVMPGNVPVWHLYVVEVSHRDRVLSVLNAAGIGAALHYPTPINLTPAFAFLGLGPGSYPVAERSAARILSLPMYPHIEPHQQERVVEVLADALKHT